MGGVQLFAMIKMLGLQFEDLNPRYHNEDAWYGYQVRELLEVVIGSPSATFPCPRFRFPCGCWR